MSIFNNLDFIKIRLKMPLYLPKSYLIFSLIKKSDSPSISLELTARSSGSEGMNWEMVWEFIFFFWYVIVTKKNGCAVHTDTHTLAILEILHCLQTLNSLRIPILISLHQFSSVQLLSCVWLFATPWTAACQASCPSPTPRACSNSCPLNQWCHPTISSSVILFSSCLQSFLASESFPVSRLFTSDGQNIEVSASASVLQMNIQDEFPLGWTGWMHKVKACKILSWWAWSDGSSSL